MNRSDTGQHKEHAGAPFGWWARIGCGCNGTPAGKPLRNNMAHNSTGETGR